MTRLAAPDRPAATPLDRLAPVVFAHARVAMMTVTTGGTVVEVNAAAAELVHRPRTEMAQEPIARHVTPRSGAPIAECLRAAAAASEAVSFGACTVRRGDRGMVVMELVVSSGCRITGRDLLLVQLAPPAEPSAPTG